MKRLLLAGLITLYSSLGFAEKNNPIEGLAAQVKIQNNCVSVQLARNQKVRECVQDVTHKGYVYQLIYSDHSEKGPSNGIVDEYDTLIIKSYESDPMVHFEDYGLDGFAKANDSDRYFIEGKPDRYPHKDWTPKERDAKNKVYLEYVSDLLTATSTQALTKR